MPDEKDPAGDAAASAATASLAMRPTAPVDDEPSLEPGHKLGRYVTLGRLGAGGMSVVYQAYDGDLDRKIAIKVMRTRYWDAAGQLRVLREAQALAQLSHPNVVSVHDVGSLGDQTFIAMELIDGITLKEWLAYEPRPWRLVLDVLVQAGRGIAAAHAAGLIHRDVKPGNVLIDKTGRARVTDFGIARPSADAHTPDSISTEDGGQADPIDVDSDHPPSGRSLLATPLTRTGTVIGTPAYMAPEQKLGRSGFRADQYSFCLMAREALLGNRSRESDADAATAASSSVPRWLRVAISRGLATDPDARYPSMDALLAAMTADPTPRRRLVVAAAASAIILGGGIAAFAYRPEPPAPCGGSEELARRGWSLELAAAVERAFVASGRSHAASTFARVDQLLGIRSAAWSAQRRDVCEATRVRGEQSERLLDVRMGCLDRRLGELEALTVVFRSRADGEVVDHAVQAVRGLPALSSCDDADALLAAMPPPDDPVTRAEATRLSVAIDEVAALAGTGKYGDALLLATTAATEATRLAWPPAEARASYWVGRLQSYTGESEASETTLERAIQRGAEARDDELVAEAGLELIYVLGYDLARPADALQTADLVDAMVRRAGSDPILEAQLLDRIGVVHWAKGAYPEAQGYFERALARYADLSADDAGALPAATLTNLGNALADQGRFDDARRHYERELEIVERVLGADHPDAARASANLGTVLLSLERFDEAQARFDRALRLWEAAYGPDHPMIAMVTNNLGDLHRQRGQPDLALPYCQRALTIGEQTLPEGHPVRAYHLVCTGHALNALGRHAEAVPILERALAIRTAASGDLVEVQLALARALWLVGGARNQARARELANTARATAVAAGSGSEEAVAAIDAWLAQR